MIKMDTKTKKSTNSKIPRKVGTIVRKKREIFEKPELETPQTQTKPVVKKGISLDRFFRSLESKNNTSNTVNRRNEEIRQPSTKKTSLVKKEEKKKPELKPKTTKIPKINLEDYRKSLNVEIDAIIEMTKSPNLEDQERMEKIMNGNFDDVDSSLTSRDSSERRSFRKNKAKAKSDKYKNLNSPRREVNDNGEYYQVFSKITNRTTIEDSSRATIEDKCRSTIEDSSRSTVEDTSKSTIEDTSRSTIEDTSIESRRKILENFGDESDEGSEIYEIAEAVNFTEEKLKISTIEINRKVERVSSGNHGDKFYFVENGENEGNFEETSVDSEVVLKRKKDMICISADTTEENDEKTNDDNNNKLELPLSLIRKRSFLYDSDEAIENDVVRNTICDDFGQVRIVTDQVNTKTNQEEYVRTPKLDNIIRELIDTEKTYLESLHIIKNIYIPQFQKFYPEHCWRIFGEIEQLYLIQKVFYNSLRRLENDVSKILDVFQNNRSLFDFYPVYCKTHKTALEVLPRFEKFLKAIAKIHDDKQQLAAHLLTPIQRLGRYILLLGNIEEELTKNDSKLNLKVRDVLEMMKMYMSRSNDEVAKSSILDIPPLRPADFGKFLMREEFEVTIKRTKRLMTVFFFENHLIFTRKSPDKKEHFNYEKHIPLEELFAKLDGTNGLIEVSNFKETKQNGKKALRILMQHEKSEIMTLWRNEIFNSLWSEMTRAKERQTNSLKKGNVSPIKKIDNSVFYEIQ